MYCNNCGSFMPEGATVCNTCGNSGDAPQQQSAPPPSQIYRYQPPPFRPPDDGGFLWGLLGFCFPVVGLVLFLVWKYERPRTASAAGKGALVYLCVWAAFMVIYFLAIFLFAFATPFFLR